MDGSGPGPAWQELCRLSTTSGMNDIDKEESVI